MLQFRTEKWQCVHRLWVLGRQNESVSNDGNLHQPEPGLHEMLSQSEHRTLNPAEADYFFMPIYVRCLTSFIYAADFPVFHGGPFAPRTHAATNMFIGAHHWLKTHLPYWERNGGRDHILVAVHDEGSCWVPSVLRPAIHLVHWGRTDVPHTSESGYAPDNYSINATHPVWQPEGHFAKLQQDKYPCYDPSKDLVIPMMHSPTKYKQSPFLGGPERNRTMLAFFKGRIQPDNPKYSRGTRQFLANISQAEDWWGKHRIWIGETAPPGHKGLYTDFLAQSTFCLALMGDGWTARFEDGLMNGCIPVIIIDNVQLTWHSIMDLDAYSLRVAQKDMARLPEILKAVPPKDVARMQANIRKVWRRHLWTSYRPYGEVARQLIQSRQNEPASQARSDIDFGQDDAFSTIIQWLYARVDDLGAHAPTRGSPRRNEVHSVDQR
ncbi:hypothetical protein ABPG75_001740 [Micractinium tetrahymenae]